jgi:hypothetical protein
MNIARLLEAERNLTGIARKVFQHVPAAEAWRPQEIHAEMARMGSNIERRVLDGCLNSLKDSGLLREPEPGRFIRNELKPRAEAPPAQPAELPAPESRRDALDELADCAAKVRELGYALKAQADCIERVALRVAEDTQRIAADGQKLQQLRDLLKSVT